MASVNTSRYPHVGSLVTEGDQQFATVMTDDPNWRYILGGPTSAPPTRCVVVRNPRQWFIYRDGLAVDGDSTKSKTFVCVICHAAVTYTRDVFLGAADNRAWANHCITCMFDFCDACFGGGRRAPECGRCKAAAQRPPQVPSAP